MIEQDKIELNRTRQDVTKFDKSYQAQIGHIEIIENPIVHTASTRFNWGVSVKK